MAGTVHGVRGGRELRRTLRAAGDDLTDLKTAHSQAATIARNRAVQLAPSVTGALRNTLRASGTKTAGIVRAGNNTKVPYAPVIHWGWKAHGITANPFASRGAQESESTWLPLYERAVADALAQIQGA